MSKRFSGREMALLTAPILAIGVAGLLLSKRPLPLAIPLDKNQMFLKFHLDRPSTIELFQGFDGAFVVEAVNGKGEAAVLNQTAPYFDVKNEGKPTLRINRNSAVGKYVWDMNPNPTRLPFRLQRVPAGTLEFGVDTFTTSTTPSAATATQGPLPLSGKWLVDRAQIESPNLATWPRNPRILLREVRVESISSATSSAGGFIKGTAQFQFKDAAMDEKTPLELKIFSPAATMAWASPVSDARPPQVPVQRVVEWSVVGIPNTISKLRVSGQVSANGRWPLSFEIEPFEFKMVKVGQKLKFKQFPVALPKN